MEAVEEDLERDRLHTATNLARHWTKNARQHAHDPEDLIHIEEARAHLAKVGAESRAVACEFSCQGAMELIVAADQVLARVPSDELSLMRDRLYKALCVEMGGSQNLPEELRGGAG